MITTRMVLFGTLCLAAAAQAPAPELGSLLQAAQIAETEWHTLAQDLDARLSRMLPCDARATRAIQEVSSASATRLAAYAQYLQVLLESAAADVKEARAIAEGQPSAVAEVAAERTDIAQEQAGIESQILNLTASAGQRASLGAALEKLKEIQGLIAQRADIAGRLPGSGDRLTGLMNDLVSALEKREAALRAYSTVLEAERERWNAFYTARTERARLECTITGGGR